MNRNFLKIAILSFVLLGNAVVFCMELVPDLDPSAGKKHIDSKVSAHDRKFVNIACKAMHGSLKNPARFMPDSVEKAYDNVVANGGDIKTAKPWIVAQLAIENDRAGLKWIFDRERDHSIQMKPLKIYPLMGYDLFNSISVEPFRIAHISKDIDTQALIVRNNMPKGFSGWSEALATESPINLEKYLLEGSARNQFSFLEHLTASKLDDVNGLKESCVKHKLSIEGKILLIKHASCGSPKVIDFFLQDKEFAMLINNEECFECFYNAIRNKKYDIAKKIAIFKGNAVDVKGKTLFDAYVEYCGVYSDKDVMQLLKDCGLKSAKELTPAYCTIS